MEFAAQAPALRGRGGSGGSIPRGERRRAAARRGDRKERDGYTKLSFETWGTHAFALCKMIKCFKLSRG